MLKVKGLKSVRSANTSFQTIEPCTARTDEKEHLLVDSSLSFVQSFSKEGDFVAAEEGCRNNSTSTVRKPRTNPPTLSLSKLSRPASQLNIRVKTTPSNQTNNFDSLLTVRRDQIKPPIVLSA